MCCIHMLSPSYIPSYVHICPGYREKSPDVQGTLDMHIFSACTHYGHKHIHFSRETCARAFPLQVLQDLPIHLQGLQVPYNTLTCTLHPY